MGAVSGRGYRAAGDASTESPRGGIPLPRSRRGAATGARGRAGERAGALGWAGALWKREARGWEAGWAGFGCRARSEAVAC